MESQLDLINNWNHLGKKNTKYPNRKEKYKMTPMGKKNTK
jgi:hypothetical protein